MGRPSPSALAAEGQRAELLAWGETRYEWGTTPTNARYTGQYQESDLDGLYYYGARWYDSKLGRFISPDTIIPGMGNPQAWDRYAYVNNNPINATDPTGHIYCKVSRPGASCMNDKPDPVIYQPIQPNHQPTKQPTIKEKAMSGDIISMIDLVVPSHIGLRGQIDISLNVLGIVGGSVDVGANIVYNARGYKLASSADISIGPGVGGGSPIGASVTGGPLIGWGSSHVEDATSGGFVTFSGAGTAGYAGALSVSTPLDINPSSTPPVSLHYDEKYGMVPATLYLGFGAGFPYYGGASLEGGGTPISADLTQYLPHWSIFNR